MGTYMYSKLIKIGVTSIATKNPALPRMAALKPLHAMILHTAWTAFSRTAAKDLPKTTSGRCQGLDRHKMRLKQKSGC